MKELVEEKLPKVPLLYHPGDQWVYSVSHDVQAYLVEHFSGMPFDELSRERIVPAARNEGCRVRRAEGVRGALRRELSEHAPDGRGSCESRRAKALLPQGAPNSAFGGYARYTRISRSAA